MAVEITIGDWRKALEEAERPLSSAPCWTVGELAVKLGVSERRASAWLRQRLDAGEMIRTRRTTTRVDGRAMTSVAFAVAPQSSRSRSKSKSR